MSSDMLSMPTEAPADTRCGTTNGASGRTPTSSACQLAKLEAAVVPATPAAADAASAVSTAAAAAAASAGTAAPTVTTITATPTVTIAPRVTNRPIDQP